MKKLLYKLSKKYKIFWLEQLYCEHDYPEDWCKMWGYKNCKKCWYIPNKTMLRNRLLEEI